MKYFFDAQTKCTWLKIIDTNKKDTWKTRPDITTPLGGGVKNVITLKKCTQ